MDFALLPPEVNSGLMYAGPGAGPMLAAAAGWDAVTAQLESAAIDYSAEVSELTTRWLGPSSMRMAAAATRKVAWLQRSAAAAGKTAAQAYAAAAAYEAAFAMTVPPPVIAENRAELLVLIATNFFGQNTAAIAANEAEYTGMWVQDAAAMYAYAADSAQASALTAFDEPSPSTNEAGRLAQADAAARPAAEAQSAAQVVANAAMQTASTTVPDGGTATVAPGNTITLVGNSAIAVSDGPVTVSGNGGLVARTSSVIVNIGSSVLFRGVDPATGINLETILDAASGPITVVAPASSPISVQILSGSVTTNGVSLIANITTNPVTALVGGTAEVSIVNITSQAGLPATGSVTITSAVTPVAAAPAAAPTGAATAASAAATSSSASASSASSAASASSVSPAGTLGISGADEILTPEVPYLGPADAVGIAADSPMHVAAAAKW